MSTTGASTAPTPPVSTPDPSGTQFSHPARGRDVADITMLAAHPLAPGREGNIYLLRGHGDPKSMQEVLSRAVQTQYPPTVAEAKAKGYFVVNAGDEPRFFWRDLDGDGDPMKDKLVLWTKAGCKHHPDVRKSLEDARKRLHGDLDDTTSGKPVFDPATKTYSGGLAFERSPEAVSLDPTKRAYPLTVSVQLQRDMDAPHKARKTVGKPLSPHATLVRDIARAGILAGIEGLEDGSEELAAMLRARADYLNVPRIGHSRNSYFPAVQLNISAAVSGEDDTSLRDVLGPFGGNHMDCGDSAGGITAMTNASYPHPDVAPEIAYCGDYMIAFIMHEFDTILFNGLHAHGAVISRYNLVRTTSRNYHRNMIICYSPSKFFDTPSSSALGSLPSAIGKERVCQVASEMKDWGASSPFSKSIGEQASFGVDGEAGMEGAEHFQHFVHALLQFNAFMVNQFPRHYLMRLDKTKFLEAFTYVDEHQVRVGCGPWDMGPGWTGSDAAPGKVYTEDLRKMPTDQLVRLHNSDTPTDVPYGNSFVANHIRDWKEHLRSWSATIPLCMASDLSGVNNIEPNPSLRRNVTKAIRKTAVAQQTTTESNSSAVNTGDGRGSNLNNEKVAVTRSTEQRKGDRRKETAPEGEDTSADKRARRTRQNEHDGHDGIREVGRGHLEGIGGTEGQCQGPVIPSVPYPFIRLSVFRSTVGDQYLT